MAVRNVRLAQSNLYAARYFAIQLRFSKTHEWIKYDTETKVSCLALMKGWLNNFQVGTVGITQFAADQLGDIVYVDLPEKGKQFDKQESVVSQSVLLC